MSVVLGLEFDLTDYQNCCVAEDRLRDYFSRKLEISDIKHMCPKYGLKTLDFIF